MPPQAIIERAEPFYFPGGPVGCVLVHGFTGTPFEMRSLGEYLNQKGYTVFGVRLAGHATSIEDMIRTRYWDWLASVEDACHMLRTHCKKIFLIGLSMGGVLSLTQAARLPVDGVVAMSTPYQLPNKWGRRFPWLMRLISPFNPSMAKGKQVWFTTEISDEHISYVRNPVRSAYELNRVIHVMRTELPRITIPALVIHSRNDNYVRDFNAGLIFEAIGSQEKQLVWTDKSNHVVTRDGDTSRVFEPIAAFLENYS